MSRTTIYLNHIRGNVHIFVKTDCRLTIIESKTELIFDCILPVRNKCSGSIRNVLCGNRIVIILHGKARNVSDLNNKMKNKNYHNFRTILKNTILSKQFLKIPHC